MKSHIPDDKIKKVYFWVLEKSKRKVEMEVDYLRFVHKKTKYRRRPFGKEYETLNLDMRKVLYANTPSDISYQLNLPSGNKTFLTFGMGVLDGSSPVEFTLMLTADGVEQKLFTKKIENNDRWFDEELDLSAYSGKEISIRFITTS